MRLPNFWIQFNKDSTLINIWDEGASECVNEGNNFYILHWATNSFPGSLCLPKLFVLLTLTTNHFLSLYESLHWRNLFISVFLSVCTRLSLLSLCHFHVVEVANSKLEQTELNVKYVLQNNRKSKNKVDSIVKFKIIQNLTSSISWHLSISWQKHSPNRPQPQIYSTIIFLI